MRNFYFFKTFLAFMLLLCSFAGVQAQATYLCNEKFSSRTPSGWSIQPTFSTTAPSWKTDSVAVLSAKYAMHGYAPYAAGDTSELVTPFYDCSQYKFVTLRFSHICKILPSDICEIQYQEQGLGSNYKWKAIPKDAYKGSCPLYKNNLNFSHESYSEWCANDTFAIPNSGWYKQETFDISNYASLSKVRFRFLIRKGSYLGSFIASGWFVDDFQILASNVAIIPPEVKFLSGPNDTVFTTGPYVVEAKVATRTTAGIIAPKLECRYTYNGKTTQSSLRMSRVSGDSIWTATIPQQLYGTTVSYAINGSDSAANTAMASAAFYVKRVPGGGFTGYVTIGNPNSTTTESYIPFYGLYDYGWSRTLYLGSELSPTSSSGMITKIAFQQSTTGNSSLSTSNQTLYFKAVKDTKLSISNYTDPLSDGATLVWSGIYDASRNGWVEYILSKPFILPAGQNLMVYWENKNGNYNGSIYWYYTATTDNMCCYKYQDNNFPNIPGTLTEKRPNTKFYLMSIGRDDSNAVALVSIDNPTNGSSSGKQPVKITLKNKGLQNLTSATVNWKVNNVLQTPKSYTGNLPCDFMDTLTLGSYTQRLNTYDTITVWVSMPNNKIDSTTNDDTLTVYSYGCDSLFHGTYTVGSSDSLHHYDFATIKDAMKLFNLCGIKGDITLAFANGIYTENLDYTNFSGISGYALTLASLSGNADSVVFRPKNGVVLTLAGASKIRFQNLSFDARQSNSYCVQLGNNSKDILFSHCTLYGKDTTTSNNAYSTIYANGTGISNIRFIGNRILFGTYSSYFYGSSSARNRDIVFDSNHLAGFAYYGIYSYYNNNLIITHNKVEETKKGYNYFYGIQVNYSDTCIINANIIRSHNFNTSNHNGIRCLYLDSNSLISNNEVCLQVSSSAYGIYIDYPYGLKVLNNTVLVYGKTTSTIYGIYQYTYTSGTYSSKILNNISVVTGATTAYPINFSNATGAKTQCTEDYNCLWNEKNVGYVGSAMTTLAAYKSAMPSAIHDVYLRPDFADSTLSLALKNHSGLDCPIHSEATQDINGRFRAGKGSMGCYANSPLKNSAALYAWINCPTTTSIGDTVCPSVILINCGTDTLKTSTILWEHNKTLQGSGISWKGNLALGESDTLPLGCVIMIPGLNTIKAYISSIGRPVDSTTVDDTLSYSTNSCKGTYAGTYTIGTKGDFPDLKTALSNINQCGASGDITLAFTSGIYTNNIAFNSSPFSGSNYTLTLTSYAQNADSVIIRPSAGTVVSLNGASGIRFRNITFDANTAKGFCVEIGGNTQDVEFRYCHILGHNAKYTSSSYSTIYKASGNVVKDIRFIGNEIIGGSYGVYFYGNSSTTRNSNIVFDSNHIYNYYYYAAYFYYNNRLTFNHNFVEEGKDIYPDNYGVIFYYADTLTANANRIRAYGHATTGEYGLRFMYTDSNTLVSNNDIILKSKGTAHGIYTDYPKGTKFINNSILVYGNSSSNLNAFYQYTYANTTYWSFVKNNIFISNGSSPYPIYITNASGAAQCNADYNCLWSNKNVGYVGSAKTTLASYKSALPSAVHDIFFHPAFKDSSISLEAKAYTGLSCPRDNEVQTDLRGNQRLINTYMGCYSDKIVSDNAGLADIIGVSASSYTHDTLCPSVILRNNGTNILTSATIRWELNNVVQGKDISWNGQLSLGMSDTISLGCFIPKAGNNTIKAYLVLTGSKDSIQDDDTIHTSTLTCSNPLAGNYTIGANGDFPDIKTALNNIKLCGIGGNITLALANGTYTDNINLNAFSGGNYSLTLTSQAKNADSVIIRPSSGTVVSLSGVSGIRFRNITFDANTAKGFCVEIGDNTQDVEFRYCHILGHNAKSTSSSYSTIYKASGYVVKDIRFIGNEIIGGSYGIYFYGSSSTLRNSNIVFDSNHIYNYYYYAAYFYYNNRLTFNHNFVEEGKDIYSYNYGVYFYYADTLTANANRIRAYGNATSYEYGLRFMYTDSNTLVSNNDIVLNSNGIAYGIYTDYPKGTKFINNSILVYGNSNNTSNLNAFYQYTYANTTYWSFVKNNIFISNGSSPYPIYITNASGAAQCNADYNCLWSNKNVGYVGSTKTTLAAYKSALPSAVHDIFFHPAFKDSSVSLELMNAKGMDCPVNQDVTTDIKDSLRTNPTCMGAYIFTPSDIDIALISISSPINHGNIQTNIPLKVVLGNFGKATVTTTKLYYVLNGTVSGPIQWNGSLKTGDTVSFTLGNISLQEGVNRLSVFSSMPNNKIDGAMDNDSLHMNVYGCKGAYAGTYTIGNDTADKFSNVNEAIEAITSCGIGGDVRLLVRSGKYPALHLENITFTDTNKTITIASLSNQTDVTFSGIFGAYLSNIAHVYFENLHIVGSQIGLAMTDQLTNVSFRGCDIVAPKNSKGDTCMGVVYENSYGSGKYLDNVRFTGNHISGGYANFYFNYMAGSTSLMTTASVIIDSNVMDEAYAYGIYSYYVNHFKSISHNYLTNRKDADEYFGFFSYYYHHIDRMVGNRIHIDNDSNACAVYFEDYVNYPAYGGQPGLIANNEIIVKGKDVKYGIVADNWCQLNIVNNSILVKGSNNSQSFALYTHAPSSNYKVNILNNNLVSMQDSGGYAFVNDYDPSAAYGVRDYNNYYSRSTTLTNMGAADQGNLAAIKAVDATQDQHSLNIAPQWKDTNSLMFKQSKLIPCPVAYNVTEDILGATRVGTTAMGCYGLEPDSTDVALVELIGVDQLTSIGTHPISVVLMNIGLNPLDTAVLRLNINGMAQNPVSYKPNTPLQYQKKDTVLLGNFIFQNGNCNLSVSVSTPNDNNANNDTVKAQRYICGKSFVGNIVIGNSTKADYSFQTIDTLIADIARCGISGDLCLQIESGNYNLGNTSIDLSVFNNLLGKYHLSITSKAGTRDSVTITSTASEFVYLYDNCNLTISNMTLVNQNGDIITFDGDCKNINILYNNLLGSSTTTSSSSGTPIFQNDGFLDGLSIIGNHIEGGYYGLYLYGMSSSEYNMNVVIDSNEIINQYYYATSISYTDLNTLSHNKIYCRTNNANTYWYGLRAYYCNIKQMLGNDIDATLSSSLNYPYAMYLYFVNCYNTQNTALVANNIIKARSTGSYYGVYAFYSKMKFYNNTILMEGTGTGRALYYSTTSTYPTDIKGNQFFANAGGYPIYAASTTSGVATLDYNNYYGGTYVGYFGSAISTLSAWQNATGMDVHSVSIAPNFINTANNLKLKSYAGMMMPRLKDVTEDFEGIGRDAITVMGAHEAIYLQLDVALNDFGKTNIIGGQSCKVEVTLVNYGKDTLTSAAIQWTFNGIAQTTYLWNGSLPMFGSTTVSIGNITPAAASTTDIVAWISTANNKADLDHSNDTIHMNTYVCGGSLSGTYTVGGTTPSFTTLQDAIDALYTCKMSGPVTLNVRSGNYGSLNISEPVSGASATNTITIIADNGAHVVVNGGSTAPALSMSNTGYWKFYGITFGDTTNNQVGVQLEEKLQNILFHGCNILASTSTTNSSSAAVRYPSTSGSTNYPVNVEFIGNRVIGGYYNFYIYYMSGSSTNMSASSMTIDSNMLSHGYSAGIYSNYYSHFKSVSYNTIHSRWNTPAVYYGIYNYEYSLIDRIVANRINAYNSSLAYGIYFSWDKNQTTYGGKAGTMSNNEIILRGSGGNKYGIYAYYLDQNWEISHNSIYLEGTSTNHGLYLYNSNTSYKLKVVNNISVVKGGSANYPIYFSSSTYVQPAYTILDYNNYITLNGQSIGYAGSAISTLSAWQATSRQDTHSVSIAPAFIDSTQSLELKDYSGIISPLLSSVPTDINGHKRTSITTMGAYGNNIYQGVDLNIEEFLSPKPIADVICYADYTPVHISIKNLGLKKAQFNTSSLKIDLDVTGAANFHFDTIIKNGSLEYLEVDTLLLTSVPTIASGTYNFKVTLTSAEDTVLGNNTLSMAYNAYRVELPYDIDFSNTPNEFVNITMNGNTAWKVVQGSGSNPTLVPTFGSGRLEFAGSDDPGAYAHAVFNAVNIQHCVKPTLSFWYAHNAACTKQDMLTVLITTDGGANYTEICRILASDTATAWKQYDIDLTPFNQSSCLSVVFRAMSFGGSNQAIDRIRIKAERDATLTLLPIDITQRSACDPTPINIRAVISNTSRMNIDMQNDTVFLNVSGAANYTNKVAYSKILNGYASDTLTIGQLSLSANGSYFIDAYMQPKDDNSANDSIHDSTLYIMQNLALDSIIGMDEQTFKVSGDKVSISAIAVNKGNMLVDKVIFHMYLDGNEVVSDTVHTPMKSGDTLIHAMSKPYTVPSVSKDQPFYFLEVRTELSCDGNADNDSIAIVGNVMIPDSIDIQVLDISVATPAKGKTKLAPSVRVDNIGNQEATNIVLHVDVIDSTKKVVASISETVNYMAANESKNIAFTMNYIVPNYTGQYTLKAYVEQYNGDTTLSNDTLSKAFASEVDDTRIRESEELNWSMGQNIPNPAGSITRIPFHLPQDAEVVFSVMSANGQLIYREEINANSGNNTLEFDVNNLANGIYYYSMECKGQRIVKKMNVAK